MTQPSAHTFGKHERIVSRKLVERLFGGGGSRSMAAYPLRVVYLPVERGEAGVQILVSVPKRRFKRAVKRNRVKRQVREAYRRNKHILGAALGCMPDRTLALAFIWQADELYDSRQVEDSMRSLLERLGERLVRKSGSHDEKSL